MLEKLSVEHLTDRDRDSSLIVLMCGIAGSGKTTFSQNWKSMVMYVFLLIRKCGLLMVDME